MQLHNKVFAKLPVEFPEELFEAVKNYISLLDVSWEQRIHPMSQEQILTVEEFVQSNFNQALPVSYKTYLKCMGYDDGDLMSSYFDSDDWKYFKPTNDSISEVLKRCSIPGQFYPFYYNVFAGLGFGFSPCTRSSEQIVVAKSEKLYCTSDTFTKFVLYLSFLYMLKRSLARLEKIKDSLEKIPLDPSGTYYSRLIVTNVSKDNIVHIIDSLEENFSIQEYWYSSSKQFHVFDFDGIATDIQYTLARYIGFSDCRDFGMCIFSDSPYLYIDTMGCGNQHIKEIVCFLRNITSLQVEVDSIKKSKLL